jgi:COP9 signalosome complex subunit 5
MVDSSTARQRWELENEIPQLGNSADIESLYKWDGDAARLLQNEKPWAKDPHYFKR